MPIAWAGEAASETKNSRLNRGFMDSPVQIIFMFSNDLCVAVLCHEENATAI
jgi:hypothetical protein